MAKKPFYSKPNRAANVKDKQIVLDYLAGKKFTKLLDTGCGIGEFTAMVGKHVKAKECHGIEIVPELAKTARKNGVKILSADLNKKLSYKNDQFDLIISIQNIEHLYFTDTYLEEMKRILKKNGRFIITTTNLAAIHYRLMLFFGVQPMCLHPSVYQTWPLKGKNPLWGHKSVFTFPALKEVLIKHGFTIEKAYTHTLYYCPDWLEKPILKILPNLGTFACYVVKK